MGCFYVGVVQMKKEYYIDLVDRVFKVLVWFEKYPNTFEPYLANLCMEIKGLDDFKETAGIYGLLNGLLLSDRTHEMVRRCVLNSIGVLDKILSNWED